MNLGRMLKIANHLESGKLAHVRFDFSCVNTYELNYLSAGKRINYCGTAGCAMGEFPKIFPRYWKFTPGFIEFKDNAEESKKDLWGVVARFLGLTRSEVKHLFNPYSQVKTYGGKTLGNGASAKEVADNMREFIKRKLNNEF